MSSVVNSMKSVRKQKGDEAQIMLSSTKITMLTFYIGFEALHGEVSISCPKCLQYFTTRLKLSKGPQ